MVNTLQQNPEAIEWLQKLPMFEKD